MAALVDGTDEERLERSRHHARFLAERGYLRDGVTLAEATDILWICNSVEIYDLLVLKRGWSLPRFARFVADFMIASLLPEHGGVAQAGCGMVQVRTVPWVNPSAEECPMATPPRLVPLLEQFDWARKRLFDRMAGPEGDSGNGVSVEIAGMTDDEYRWEPVPNCWSIRPRAAGPGPGATVLVGAGEWGRDSARPPHPSPPPFTTIAWRLGHLSEMLTLRADHTIGSHALTRDGYRFCGDAAGALAAFDAGAAAWRGALVSADDAALDMVGRSTYPDGSDPDDPFIDTVWWVNQELLHHGAEIALLRDLYRARRG